MAVNDHYRSGLSDAIKRALVILLEDGKLTRKQGIWSGKSGRLVYLPTVEALYDRYLCKIFAGSKFTRRDRMQSDPTRMCFTAELTEVGEFAAREISRGFIFEDTPPLQHKISEQAAMLIAEVVG